MIQVNVKTNTDGFIRVEVTGHTDSILCSSVSTLMQSNVRFLQELASKHPDKINVKVED